MKALFIVLALTVGAIAGSLISSAVHPDSGRLPKHPDPYLHNGR